MSRTPGALHGIGLSLVGLVAAALIPLLVFGGCVAWMIVDQKKAAVAAELASTASALRVAVDRELTGQFDAMEILANDVDVSGNNFSAFNERAGRIIAAHGDWRNVVLIDPHSHRIVASGLPLPVPAPSTSAPDSVDEVVRTRRPIISGLLAGGAIVRQPLVLSMAPVIRKGEVRFVLAVAMDPKPLSDIFAEQRLATSWTGAIVDNHMLLAGRSRDPERFVGRRSTPTLADRIAASDSGMFTALNQEGATVYTVFSRSAITGWSVAIGVPAAEVEQPIEKMLGQLAAGGGALIAFALLLTGLVGRSIVRRRNAYERQLYESKSRLDMALAGADMATWDWHIPSGDLLFDARWAEMLGYALDELAPRVESWETRVFPDDLPMVWQKLERHFNGELPAYEAEHRVRHKDGHWVWVVGRGKVVERDAQGKPVRAVGTALDITERKTMEAERNELNRDFVNFLENTTDFIYFKDADSRFRFCSQTQANITGHASWRDMIGKHDREVFPEETAKIYAEEETPIFSEGVPLLGRIDPYYDAAGNIRWVSTSKWPILGEDGKVIGIFGVSRDVTAAKKDEAELERHRHHLEELVEQRTAALVATEAKASQILQSSADGLYGVDQTGKITFINPAACLMLGYRAEQAIGLSAHTLFHHSKPDGTPFPIDECPGHDAVRRGHEMRIDNEVYWHADGHAVPVMYAIHPIIQDGRAMGAVISFVDMSAQRAAALAREQALLAAENLARVRSEFLANMSHEIRTPLNGVLGFAEIGRRNFADSQKARNAFEKILSSGTLLLGVINEILDFSKIEAGKIRIEQTAVSLAAVIRHSVELVGERAAVKGVVLRVESAAALPADCLTDPLRLSQVLLNLLSNAVKFTEHGSVTLSVARQGDELVFAISDTGIGMTTEQLAQLFNPFQQADGSTTRRFGGTGLGLAISKRLIELMGGHIRAESRPGVGSVFEFRVPYIPVPEGPARPGVESPSARPQDKPLTGISILVAEDDAINQLVLEDNLKDDGATVVMVGNGQAAVERVLRDGAQAYDVVLMDIQMPEMDGYQATQLILELAPGMPIIGQTAHASSEERDKCLAAGMVGHIAKPIDSDALVRVILEQIKRKRGS